MKTKSSPSWYRYCIVRLSTVAVSTLVPALNVRSTTLPDSTFFSVVRTNAPPLPGLTCWNSTMAHSSPSRLRTRPFLRSFVVAMRGPHSFLRRFRGRQKCTRQGPSVSDSPRRVALLRNFTYRHISIDRRFTGGGHAGTPLTTRPRYGGARGR